MRDLAYLLRDRVSVVWTVLIAATVASWWMGTHAPGAVAEIDGGAGTVILAISMVKVRFVGLYFMELRDAPVALRLILEGYCAVVFCVLAAVLLMT